MTRLNYNIFVNDHKKKGMKKMDNKQVAIRIKKLRKESQLTQEQLASYLGVDQTLITKLENGSRNINVTLIEKICCLFGCTEAYLMGEENEYIPIQFAFRSKEIDTNDLENIAMLNRIVLNLRFMNTKLEEDLS